MKTYQKIMTTFLFGSINRPVLENTEQNHNQRQRQSHQDINLENLGTQGFQQVVENVRPQVINQTMRIVHFVKMATGIPIYHTKPMPDVKQIQQKTSGSSLMSDAVPQRPRESVQDFSESNTERQGRRQDEQAIQKPPIPNPYHVSTQSMLGKEQGDKHTPPVSADVSETNRKKQDNNERQGKQVSHNPSIPNSDHLSTQDMLEQERANEHHPPLSTNFSETNKEIQGKNENQGQQISHSPSITKSDHLSRQGLLEQEQGNAHRQSLSADVSETNNVQDGQVNHKPPIPNSDNVSMQNNTTDHNKITFVTPVPNMAKGTKTGLLHEQTVQESNILTDEPSMDLKSSEDVESATVNSRQWTSSRQRGRSRYRNRYRNRYGNRNRNSRYRWRPSGGNRGGGNTGGPWNRPGSSGQGVGMVPGGGGPAGSPAPQTGSAFADDALQAHNKYRRVHNAGPMRLDRDLSNQAQGYAQKIASMHSLTHSSNQERGDDVGENLAYACKMNGVPLTGSETTKMWYDEVCEYNFNRGGFSMNTGHFTQVVWTDSLDLGMGMAETSENGMSCIYAVGRYRQAGNYGGQFRDKVVRGNFDRSYCNDVKKG